MEGWRAFGLELTKKSARGLKELLNKMLSDRVDSSLYSRVGLMLMG